MKIIALIPCHNRRDHTLSCLRALMAQRGGAELGAVVVDDGSDDGTSEAICSEFEAVQLLRGDGDLYWAASIAAAERQALQHRPDYLLWLNDDVVLGTDALDGLLGTIAAARSHLAIAVGCLLDPELHEISYSGVRRVDWHPMRYEHVVPSATPSHAETFNGNVVLVPRKVAELVGGIDGRFAHAFADFDYGLRARRLGVEILVSSEPVGVCKRNGHGPPSWQDPELPVHARWSALLNRKGLPPRSLARYLARHGGVAWPLFWAAPYVRLAVDSVRAPFRQLSNHAAGISGGYHVGRDVTRNDTAGSDHAARTDRDAT